MITCHLKYVIDATKMAEFEQYCRMWLPLIKKFGGVHHGYLLPSEGASNIALGSFSFPSLAAYEQYRISSLDDPECQVAFRFSKETRCFLSYERTFFRPLFPE
ncbi:NIPSNAP family protein [Jeongeupia wiesaeckerbachi]|uniref:NIPSNAP family protein n=1 Tax=Jeongeupia wiesaeckerbachi TaxID=3051218 RepID=UPI003D80762B